MAVTYPSVKALQAIKDVTREDAKRIRAIMTGAELTPNGVTRMDAIDRVLRTCGVEYQEAGSNRRSPAFYYCNAGDTYATTVLKVRGRFRVGCWGDIVERGRYA
jgi:hypothetical protein